ncbi:MAG: MoxR family ATPase [Clostridia bacterium]|nr:MoxR family ATPase [Clostridia bacterium]
MPTEQDILSFRQQLESIKTEISKEIVGQREVIDTLVLALVAGGNVLLEGVPGLGKTRLVRTLSRVLDLPFSRIQFTPDLMPADITGTSIMEKNESGSAFRFQPGPLFASIVLADEINRATPKTQSALLEAMQEHAVTVSGVSRPMAEPYFVLATQNPVEQEGTYPLPEAQLDRFLFKVLVPFPTLEELDGIVNMTTAGEEPRANKAADGKDILRLREISRQVPVAQAVQRYALQLVLNTHPELPESPAVSRGCLRFGASPRAAQAMLSAARVRALAQGRFNVAYEDINALAKPCLRHRIALSFEGMAQGRTPDDIIDELMKESGR